MTGRPFEHMLEENIEKERVLPAAPDSLTDTPSWARVTDYYLHGVDGSISNRHWALDRDFADYLDYVLPADRLLAHEHRLFGKRAVEYMLGNGIRQFVDLGSGAARDDTAIHAIADAWDERHGNRPNTTVCYVDNDTVAVAHTTLELDKLEQPKRLSVVHADLRQPYSLWKKVLEESPISRRKPVGLIATGVMQQAQPDRWGEETGVASLGSLRQLLPKNSFLALSHATSDLENSTDATNEQAGQMLAAIYRAYRVERVAHFLMRSRESIEGLMGDYELANGGWKTATEWGKRGARRQDPHMPERKTGYPVVWAGLGRKA